MDRMCKAEPVGQRRQGITAGVGIIMDPQSPERGAAQLHQVLRDVQWRDGVAARSRVLATTEFNRDRLAGELAQVLSECVTALE